MREHSLESILNSDNGSGLTKVSDSAYPVLAQKAWPATFMTLLTCLVDKAPTNKQASQHLKTNRPCVSMTNMRARRHAAVTMPSECMLLGLLMFLLLNLNLLLLLNLMALSGTLLPERHRLTHLYASTLIKARDIAKHEERSRRVTCPSVIAHPPMRSK